MTAADVTRILHSRGAVIIACILAVTAAVTAYVCGHMPDPPQTDGLVREWRGLPQPPQPLSMTIALALCIGTAWLTGHINKVYNLLRSMTMLHATLLLVMLTSTPALLLWPTTGMLLCIVVVLCMYLLMSTYADAETAPRRVFLSFFLLSSTAAVDFSAVFYLPVFLLGCAQLRVFSLRTLLASLLGIATPWILLLGFGIVDISSLQVPSSLFHPFDLEAPLPRPVMAVAAVTAFVTVAAWVQNILKVLTYNARSRAALSLVTVLTLVTLLLCAVDFSDMYSYLPLLDLCAALQLGHLFGVVYRMPRSYIAILVVVAVYVALLVVAVAL